jgi:probable O-glycosylation ligase (exosortase A-associated)
MAYGFAYDFPFSMIIALFTVISIILSKEKKQIPWCALVFVWICFLLWINICTIFAIDVDLALPEWQRTMKIQFMVLITMMIMNDKIRINSLIWVIVISLGFYGIKGGIFALLTGGEYRVWGPEGTFIEDNNTLALALIMVLPLMRYIQLETSHRYIKVGMGLGMLITTFSVLASQSRGALIALIMMVIFMMLKSQKRKILTLVIIIMVPIILVFMPQSWYDRMATLETYEQDSSAVGRLIAWQFATDMASQRFTGGGFGSFTAENYAVFSPELLDDVVRADNRYQGAHSIYFEILGHQGFPGLILFISIGILAYRTGSTIIMNSKNNDDQLSWEGNLAAMLQVSLVGYLTGGAFLSLAYYDLYYQIIAILALLKIRSARIKDRPDKGNDRCPYSPDLS